MFWASIVCAEGHFHISLLCFALFVVMPIGRIFAHTLVPMSCLA